MSMLEFLAKPDVMRVQARCATCRGAVVADVNAQLSDGGASLRIPPEHAGHLISFREYLETGVVGPWSRQRAAVVENTWSGQRLPTCGGDTPACGQWLRLTPEHL